MKKRLLAVVLSLTMTAGLLMGCGSAAEENAAPETEEARETGTETEAAQAAQEVAENVQGTGDPEPFKIGFPWDTSSTDPTWISIYDSVKVAVEAAGGELVNVQTDLSADDLINNVSELISRDCDGILFMPASDSMLPTVDAMCAEAGVYWGTMFRTISDEEIREQVYASEWFAGGCNENDEECAANVVKTMASMRVENLCCINIAKGDTSSDLRDMGAAKGAEEAGVKILNTTYDIAVTTDMTKTIESYIAAYPEMDGILLLGTYCDAALPTIEKALSDHNKAGEVIVGRIDFDSTMGEYLEAGSFHVSYGGQQQIDPLISSVILVNKVIGTPLEEEGPCIIITPYLELTTAEESTQFNEFFLGDTTVYTKEEIKESMIRFYDPNVTKESVEKLLEGFSIADVVERHG